MEKTCELFEKEASLADILFLVGLFQIAVLRMIYSIKYPYDSSSKSIRKILSKVGLASPEKESGNEGRLVEPAWIIFGTFVSSFVFGFGLTMYFRWDRVFNGKFLYLGGHQYFRIAESWVICTGAMPHISGGVTEILQFVGAVLVQLAALLFWWVHQEMGANWTPVIHVKKEHKLVTGGNIE